MYDEKLNNSVNLRMISDVPLGGLLSGGYDSSLIVAIMKNHSQQKIETFTIGFEEKSFNEAPHAKLVAKYLNTKHHELTFTLNDLLGLIEDIPLFYDEPFADSSQLPMMLVSKLAKNNVTVALSGDGGDELFAGYDSYDYLNRYSKYKLLSKFLIKLKKFIPFEDMLKYIPIEYHKLLHLYSKISLFFSSLFFIASV